MTVVARSEVGREAWDAFCDASEETWLFHRYDWCEMECSQFSLDDHSFAVTEGGEVMGLVPLYLRRNGLGTWIETVLDCGCHRHTGLAVAPGLPKAVQRRIRREMMARIEALGRQLDVDRIQLNCHPLVPARQNAGAEDVPFWVLDHGFHLGLNFGPGGMNPAPGLSTTCADQVVILAGRSEEDVFADVDESCRRAIRKGMKAGFALEIASGQDAVAAYYAIAQESAKRTGESLSPLAYFDAIDRNLASAGRSRVLFASLDGVRAAAVFLLSDRNAVSFLAGVSLEEFFPQRVNDWLHWNAILWALRSGYRAYRLGPTYPEVPAEWAVARVSRFKGKWGGRSLQILQGSQFRYPSKYLEDAIRSVRLTCAERAAAAEPRAD